MEQYLIYAGIALGGYLLRHWNIGAGFAHNMLSLLNLNPSADPAVKVSPVAPVAPVSPVVSAAEQELLTLLQNVKTAMAAKVQADLQSLLTSALQPAVAPPQGSK